MTTNCKQYYFDKFGIICLWPVNNKDDMVSTFTAAKFFYCQLVAEHC